MSLKPGFDAPSYLLGKKDGGGGGGTQKLYLYSSEATKNMYQALGLSGTQPFLSSELSPNTYSPIMVVKYETSNDAARLQASANGNYMWRDQGWNAGKGYISIIYPQKIKAGVYHKLCMKVQINGLLTNPIIKMGLGADIAFDNSHSFFVMDIISKTVADSSTPTGSDFITVELDISAVSSAFYFGMYANDVSWSLNNFWLE